MHLVSRLHSDVSKHVFTLNAGSWTRMWSFKQLCLQLVQSTRSASVEVRRYHLILSLTINTLSVKSAWLWLIWAIGKRHLDVDWKWGETDAFGVQGPICPHWFSPNSIWLLNLRSLGLGKIEQKTLFILVWSHIKLLTFPTALFHLLIA